MEVQLSPINTHFKILTTCSQVCVKWSRADIAPAPAGPSTPALRKLRWRHSDAHPRPADVKASCPDHWPIRGLSWAPVTNERSVISPSSSGHNHGHTGLPGHNGWSARICLIVLKNYTNWMIYLPYIYLHSYGETTSSIKKFQSIYLSISQGPSKCLLIWKSQTWNFGLN